MPVGTAGQKGTRSGTNPWSALLTIVCEFVELGMNLSRL